MKKLPVLLAWFLQSGVLPLAAVDPDALQRIPGPLRPWIGWATWDDVHRDCPTPYSDPARHWCFWPSVLALDAGPDGGRFRLEVAVFHPAWVPLPGGGAWPMAVRSEDGPVAVVEHGGVPSVRLAAGNHVLQGTFIWGALPQNLAVPPSIGVLDLTVEGRRVEAPAWDAEGRVWLKRDARAADGEKDFLSVRVASALEDGIPVWLRREVELTVSGRSREVELGAVLPEGWRAASVEAPVPVAVDDAGRMKAQVRAGKWVVRLDAFRLDDPREIRYAPGVAPAVAEEWIGLRSRPELRVVELSGAPAVDVSQTTYPARWRELPVFRWDTAQPLRLEQRMRGMGEQRPGGLAITREWWLDEDGRALTFRDRVAGRMQEIWRLDAADGADLGSVRSGGEGQLITRSPGTGAPGVEIRSRDLDLEATGRMDRTRDLPATGWRSDAESVQVTLHLPPGWRLLALLGADWVEGDWLTSWTLLDLFILLIFALTIARLRGWPPAVLAFVALGISYHEPGAPRYLWLALLVPLALERGVTAAGPRRWVAAAKWGVVAGLGLVLAPFVARQVQQAIYPQLEAVRPPAGRTGAAIASVPSEAAPEAPFTGSFGSPEPARRSPAVALAGNLMNDPKARIQTGPGVPEWRWRAVGFGWSGPVGAAQRVRPVLIPMPVERVLTVVRVGLLLALAGWLLRRRDRPSPTGAGPAPGPRPAGPAAGGAATVAAGLVAGWLLIGGDRVRAAEPGAVFPDPALLSTLRERLLQAPDAHPTAADIPSVTLRIAGRRLRIEAEVHAAVRTAVPLPGRLPAWSPVKVEADGRPLASVRREDGFLWAVFEPGVSRVVIEGALPEGALEWEWAFLLRPRRVVIDAPGWQVRGVGPEGVPEGQVFFTAEERTPAGGSSYERQELQTVARVDRHLELGLQWQVRTVVTRLSPPGRALALRIPLLPGENVLSEGATVRDGMIEVRLGAGDATFSWESGLTPVPEVALVTRAEDTWVERWHGIASPVWNVAVSGLAPVFEAGRAELVPVWHPWPGESARLAVVRPEALTGATLTVSRATHTVRLGRRQSTSTLELALRSSLGEDFVVELPPDAEVATLTHDGRAVPVRRDGRRVVIPVRPGEQSLSIEWKVAAPLGLRAEPGEVGLPVGAANVHTVIEPPESRWVLWAAGPRRGPAVRFWVILACALIAAVLLSRPARSPLRPVEWALLGIGLTQVPFPAAALVVVWLWALVARGDPRVRDLAQAPFNLMQAGLVGLTAVALGILVMAVGEGLLGNPEMFITGNGSGRTRLQWFLDRTAGALPRPSIVSVSIWWYRLLMLLWALWLAAALIRWLGTGWRNFSDGGVIRRRTRAATPPPPPSPPPLPTPGT